MLSTTANLIPKHKRTKEKGVHQTEYSSLNFNKWLYKSPYVPCSDINYELEGTKQAEKRCKIDKSACATYASIGDIDDETILVNYLPGIEWYVIL